MVPSGSKGLHSRPLPAEEEALRTAVEHLAGRIGPRSWRNIRALQEAAEFIQERFRQAGYSPRAQPFRYEGGTYLNIEAVAEGQGPALVVGAHYDTVEGSPGADDNASGVGLLLELARLWSKDAGGRKVHFVAFSLEEPPVFGSSRMGSYVYAASLGGQELLGMLSLEMVGYYTDREDSQLYPLPFFRWRYPSRGNFVALVGNTSSRALVRRLHRAMKDTGLIPVESLAAPALVPGVSFSDHWSFWQAGYQALMVTDTAFYRNPYYHSPADVPHTLDYPRMALLLRALHEALKVL